MLEKDLIVKLLQQGKFKPAEIRLCGYNLFSSFMSDGFDNLLQKELKELEYKNFLDTMYWQVVKLQKKSKVNKSACAICSSQKSLVLHHNTYKNHGAEHLHLEDLIYVCHRCHSMIHENIEIGKHSQYINTDFEPLEWDEFWDKFDKKIKKSVALKLWDKLTEKEYDLMCSHIDYYLECKTDKKHRMSPANYLAHFCKGTISSKKDIQMTRDITHFVEDGKIYVR